MQALLAEQTRLARLRDQPSSRLAPSEQDSEDWDLEEEDAQAAEGSTEFPMPCTFGSIGAAISGGALGFVFGFGTLQVLQRGVSTRSTLDL